MILQCSEREEGLVLSSLFLCFRPCVLIVAAFVSVCRLLIICAKLQSKLAKMDADLYDEFGNYIGPELDSEEEEDDDFEQYNAPNDDDEDEGVQNNVSPLQFS